MSALLSVDEISNLGSHVSKMALHQLFGWMIGAARADDFNPNSAAIHKELSEFFRNCAAHDLEYEKQGKGFMRVLTGLSDERLEAIADGKKVKL